MAVHKVLYVREDDDVALTGDLIEYEGRLWLVPEWLEGPTAGTRCPARIIDTGGLSLMKAGAEHPVDYVLGVPLSRNVLEGRGARLGLDVRQRPDIHLRVDTDFRR